MAVDFLLSFLQSASDFLWEYPALILMVAVGLFFTVRSRFFQFRRFPSVVSNFYQMMRSRGPERPGVHPLTAFFASLGGAIGIGNVVVICAAVQIGGPGALFWTWVTGLLGMMLKYAEVFLGMRFRVRNAAGSYDGGPMYFLPRAYKSRWIAIFAAVLLCIYGVEVFVFSELTYTFSVNWHINRYVVIGVLLTLVLLASLGGVKRVGQISRTIIPLFVLLYMAMGLWVVAINIEKLPAILSLIFKSAFSGHAPIGAFAGASWVLAMGQGAARGCYSADIGIGYASVIHSESNAVRPERQAALAVLGVFIDTFVCTLSVFIILLTGVWAEPFQSGALVQAALGKYFPGMNFFMPFFLFLLGYSTIIAYFVFGIKCASYLSPRFGKWAYLVYGGLSLLGFALMEPKSALALMTLTGGLLLIINVIAFYLLRKEVRFHLDPEPSTAPQESLLAKD